jgi:hypothetical protein
MLEDLLNLRRRFATIRHREAPPLRERENFLEHLHRQVQVSQRCVAFPGNC